MVHIPGKDLVVPESVSYLVEPPSRSDSQATEIFRRASELDLSRAIRSQEISQTVSRRFTSLVEAELASAAIRTITPEWLGGGSIPRLVVSFRYDGLDSFGIADMTARLDLAARRAGALQRRLASGEQVDDWPRALRTTQGGLYLLDVRRGSYEVIQTIWGDLVTIAGSTPVSVASFIALAWDIGRGTRKLANKWTGRRASIGPNAKPTPTSDSEGTEWGATHTKALAPVLLAAIENDQGVEFHLKDDNREIKLTVYPKDQS
jgi:hypothetical protein